MSLCQLRTGSAFAVLALWARNLQAYGPSQLSHYEFTSESGKKWDVNFCSMRNNRFYQLEVWGDLIGIGGTLDPPTFSYDIAGEVFTKSKRICWRYKSGRALQTFPGYGA